MPTATFAIALEAGGVSIRKTITRTADHPNSYEVSLAAGKAGQLTTRTDANTGTLTMGGGHGITTGAIIDIYWSGGVQYNVTVGTVSGNSVPFDAGVGDNLPTNLTNVVACVQTVINTPIDGDRLAILGICLESSEASGAKGHVDFQDASDDSIAELDLVGNEPRVFDITGGATNIFTGDPITHIQASNGSSTAAATLKIVALEDATP